MQFLVISETDGTAVHECATAKGADAWLRTAPVGKYAILKRHRIGIEVAEKPATNTVSGGTGFTTRKPRSSSAAAKDGAKK